MNGPTAPTSSPSSMRRDIATAYVATAARIGAWAMVSALVYRNMGAGAFAALTLARGTVGLLNYVSFGMALALLRRLAMEQARVVPALPVELEPQASDRTLSYASPQTGRDSFPAATPIQTLYYSGLATLTVSAFLGALALLLLADTLGDELHVGKGLRQEIGAVVCFMGFGVLLRMISDASGALLQSSGRIAIDNVLLAVADLAWALMCWISISQDPNHLPRVAGYFTAAGFGLLVVRFVVAELMTRVSIRNVRIDWHAGWSMMGYGMLVTLAQLADFLYAPAAYLLINQLLAPSVLAIYAPVIQIDAAMLVLVGGLASVLLPRVALAHGAGQSAMVRAYYLRGTLASVLALSLTASAFYLLAPQVFRLWLGDEMPATRAILPLMLFSTIVGGSGMVGRSILIGIGKVKPFTIAALIAGVANVVLGFVFVKYLGLGLRGIVYATMIVVVARAGVWLPWYVMRTLNKAEGRGQKAESETAGDRLG